MAEVPATLIHVHLLPTLIPPGVLRGGVAVVVDVLRASSVMVHALAAGCTAVRPCLEIDEARRLAAGLPTGSALLAGERHGRPIDGFDLGNSPAEFTPQACRGKTVVLTTTNGTRAVLACLEADVVLVASFNNRLATLGRLARLHVERPGRPIHIVCSGTEGAVSLEDALLAGTFVGELMHPGAEEGAPNGAPKDSGSSSAVDLWSPDLGNDEAILVDAMRMGMAEVIDAGPSLAQILACGRGGKNVISLGLERDIFDAADVDRFDVAAELRRDPLRIVATR